MKTIVFLSIIAIALASQECGENSHFENCGTACPLTCENYDNPPKICVLRCDIGCQCDEGYVKSSDGRCVRPEECPNSADGIVVLNASKKDFCNLPRDGGNCHQIFRTKYYYDNSTGKCLPFSYSGCGGNENRFHKLLDCRYTCAKLPPDCMDDKEVGKCKERLTRYFYNMDTEQCEEFVYSGCNGNTNNFHSKDDCEALCKSSKKQTCTEEPDAGKCSGYFPQFYYEPKSGTCKEFIYTGCGSNGNRYATEDDCIEHCGVPKKKTCTEEPDAGKCSGFLRQFYYEPKSGTCKEFIYRGCGSNGNRYATEEDCMENCGGVSAAPSACKQEKKVGLCKGRFIRYYFNEDTGKCEEFIYGGCNGNSNNFLSQEDCEAVCKV